MGNENERKRDPAENRKNEMGHQWDEVKTGGNERNVGLTGDAGFGPGGAGVGSSSVGTPGIIGGSAEFLSGESRQQSAEGSGAADQSIGSETKQVLTGDQGGDDSFGGQAGSGTSAIAANNSSDDLGAAGAGPGGGKNPSDEGAEEPATGPGGQSEIGGASDLGGGETGLGSGRGSIASGGDESSDYLEGDGNPQAGFAERGRGAPEGTQPGGVEGSGKERTANRDTDIEGNSTR